jgi:hypothetical protein
VGDYPDAIQVTYTSGVATLAEVPPHASQAVELLAQHYYDHPGCPAPDGVLHLIHTFRVVSADLDQQMGARW